MEPYYYGKMNKEQQAAYRVMCQGFCSLSDQFLIPKLSGEELGEVFLRLRFDHPEIFWVPGYRFQYYRDSPNLILKPEYLFEKSRIREQQKAMEARVRKLAQPAMKLSEWEKEKYVHDFICQNVRYDKLKKPYSHEIIGPLGQGVGVCEGIAKSVKILCDALGLWCMIAICGNNPGKGIKYRHTWNILKIGGEYFHLDATFDNSLGRSAGGEEIRYDYFNLGDEQIFRDHEPLIAPAPACSQKGSFYYREKKLSFTKAEEVGKRARQAAQKGRPRTFHWRGGYLTRETFNELVEQICQAGEKCGKRAVVGVNWPQAVIRFFYEEGGVSGGAAPAGADSQAEEGGAPTSFSRARVHVEEANEGEQIGPEG